jgi:hypothetical protein
LRSRSLRAFLNPPDRLAEGVEGGERLGDLAPFAYPGFVGTSSPKVHGLFVRSLQQMQKVNLGFQTENRLALSFNLDEEGYDEARGREFSHQLYDAILNRSSDLILPTDIVRLISLEDLIARLPLAIRILPQAPHARSSTANMPPDWREPPTGCASTPADIPKRSHGSIDMSRSNFAGR